MVVSAPLLALGTLEATIGLTQHSTEAGVVSGTYGNKDHFAGLLELILPFAVMHAAALLYRDRASLGSRLKACILVLLSGIIFAAITSSLSKMGFLCTICSLTLMGSVVLFPRIPGWRKWPLLTGLGGLAVFIFVFFSPAKLIESFGNAAFDPSAEGRGPSLRTPCACFRLILSSA